VWYFLRHFHSSQFTPLHFHRNRPFNWVHQSAWQQVTSSRNQSYQEANVQMLFGNDKRYVIIRHKLLI
jgi:hypothetical protein